MERKIIDEDNEFLTSGGSEFQSQKDRKMLFPSDERTKLGMERTSELDDIVGTACLFIGIDLFGFVYVRKQSL